MNTFNIGSTEFKWSAITVIIWLVVLISGIASTYVLGSFFEYLIGLI